MPRGSRLSARREVSVLALSAAVYFATRELFEGSTARAEANARRILEVERLLRVDIEQGIQAVTLRWPPVVEVANRSYVWLHWPFVVATFAILLRRDPSRFRLLRNSLFLSGAVGLLLFACVPVAPPRFMPGFSGTVTQAERQHFLWYPSNWQNRYASFPSFHVGWTLLASMALAGTVSTRRTKALALAPALLVALAVLVTGNHYVVDVVVGVAISAGCWTYLSRRSEPCRS